MKFMWMQRLLAAALVAAGIGSTAAQADVVTQYSFEGDLLDTGPGGAAADDLTALIVGGVGSESYEAGLIGQAVRLSQATGSAFRLRALDSPDVRLAANWTLEAYLMPDLNNVGHWDRLWTKWGAGSNDWHLAMRNGDDALDLFVNGGGAAIMHGITGRPLNTVPLGRWSHIAVVGDSAANQTRGYINGQHVVTGGYAPINGGVGSMDFGNFDATTNDLQWTGLIDEAMIHNTVQDAAYLLSRGEQVPPNPYSYVTATKEHLAGAHNQFPASNADLLQAAGVTASTTGYAPCCGGANPPFGQPHVVLRDGSVGASTAAAVIWPELVLEVPNSAQGGDPNGTFSTTFNLDLSAAPLGYDISQIDTIAGWDAFRSQQRYSLWVSRTDTADFDFIGVFQIEDNNAGASLGTGSSRIRLMGEGGLPIALNVDAIRFDFIKTGNSDGGPVYREIDVFGTATIPEPSTMVLVACGLAVLLVRPIRRR